MTKSTDVQFESARPVIAELERAIVWAYQRAGDRLEERKVTAIIQTRGRKAKCQALFTANQWSTREGEDVHEISFSSEMLNYDPTDIIAAAVHETVHLFNHDIGVKDCSKSGRHNGAFKEAAETTFGLVCDEPHDSLGYAYTEPGEQLAEAIRTEFVPDHDAFRIFRKALATTERKPPKTNSWKCNCTRVRLAAKQQLDAQCRKCDSPFEPETKGDSSES